MADLEELELEEDMEDFEEELEEGFEDFEEMDGGDNMGEDPSLGVASGGDGGKGVEGSAKAGAGAKRVSARWRNGGSTGGRSSARRGLLAAVGDNVTTVKARANAPPPSPLRDAPGDPAAATPAMQAMEAAAAELHASLRESCQSLQLQLANAQRRWKLDALGWEPTNRKHTTTADLPRRRLAWSATEKEWLRRALLLFGLERWDALRRALTRGSTKPSRHALGDCADCAFAIVRSAASCASDPKERAYLEKRARDGPPQSSDSAARFGVWEKADRLAGVWARRLLLLDELQEVIAYLTDARLTDYRGTVLNALRAIEGSNPPAPWWTHDADVALLMGMHKHGYAKYDSVRVDPEFKAAFGGIRAEPGTADAAAAAKTEQDGGADDEAPAAAADPDSNNNNADAAKEADATAKADDDDDDTNKTQRRRVVKAGVDEWPIPDTLTRRLKRLLDHAQRAAQKLRKNKLLGVTHAILSGSYPLGQQQAVPPPPPGVTRRGSGGAKEAPEASKEPVVPPTAIEKLRIVRTLIDKGIPRDERGACDYEALNVMAGELKGGAGATEMAHRALQLEAERAMLQDTGVTAAAPDAGGNTVDSVDDATMKVLEEHCKAGGEAPRMGGKLAAELLDRVRLFDGVRAGMGALDSSGGDDAPFWSMLAQDATLSHDVQTFWVVSSGDRLLAAELMRHGHPSLPGWREAVWSERTSRPDGLGALVATQVPQSAAEDAAVPDDVFPSVEWLAARSTALSARLRQHAALVAQESGGAAAAAAVAGGAAMGLLMPPQPVKRKTSGPRGAGGDGTERKPRAPKEPKAPMVDPTVEPTLHGVGGMRPSGAAVNPNPIQWLRPPKRVKYAKKTDVERDANGRPVYPIQITDRVQIQSLGTIVWDRDTYHNERHIFPVGFKSSREFASRVDPNGRTYYDSEILDGGDGPLFRVTPHDAPHLRVERESASGVWVAIANAVNAVRGGQRSKVTVSGTEMYGLSHPLVSILIQELPGVENLRKFKPQISFASQELPTGFWGASQAAGVGAGAPAPPFPPALDGAMPPPPPPGVGAGADGGMMPPPPPHGGMMPPPPPHGGMMPPPPPHGGMMPPPPPQGGMMPPPPPQGGMMPPPPPQGGMMPPPPPPAS